MKNARLVQADLAKVIGDRETMMVCQLHYWSSKPKIGEVLNGVKYIRNTYDDWLSDENFPFWSKSTVRRIFDKLVRIGVVFAKKTRNKWDQTKCYALNYYHEVIKPHFDVPYSALRSVQNEQLPSVQNEQLNNTYNTPERTTEKTYKEPPVSFSSNSLGKSRASVVRDEGDKDAAPTSTRKHSSDYREDFPKAEEWIKRQSMDFRKKVEEYCEYHCNGPKVMYPKAVKMKIMVEIWKKEHGLPNMTDFHYVDKEKLKNVQGVTIESEKVERVDGFEEYMMQQYLTGDLYEPLA